MEQRDHGNGAAEADAVMCELCIRWDGTPRHLDMVENYGVDGYTKTDGTAGDETINLPKMLRKQELEAGTDI